MIMPPSQCSSKHPPPCPLAQCSYDHASFPMLQQTHPFAQCSNEHSPAQCSTNMSPVQCSNEHTLCPVLRWSHLLPNAPMNTPPSAVLQKTCSIYSVPINTPLPSALMNTNPFQCSNKHAHAQCSNEHAPAQYAGSTVDCHSGQVTCWTIGGLGCHALYWEEIWRF